MTRIRDMGQIVEEGRKLRQSGKSWFEISERLHIFTKEGRIDSGLAYRIIEQDYQPRRIETQIRLGLAPVCPTCHRPLHEKRKRRRRSLLDYPDKELKAMFENRQEY